MSQPIDYDTVVAINAEHGGDGAGVRDEKALRGAVERPFDTFDADELYPSVWTKAAVLVQGISATQYFLDGNKRTGFLTAMTFLEANGFRMADVEPVQAEAFVQSVAAGLLDLPRVAEWFEVAHEQRRAGYAIDPRVEYLIFAKSATTSDDGVLNLLRGGMASIIAPLPIVTSATLAGRIHWRTEDLGANHEVSITVETDSLDDEMRDFAWGFRFDPPVIGGHAHHDDGIIPSVFAIEVTRLYEQGGLHLFRVRIDGVTAGLIPINVVDVTPPIG